MKLICGIDEAGRGCLAGPVVSAAIIIEKNKIPEGIKDSKKLSDARRRSFYSFLVEHGISYSVGIASNKEIDRLNVLRAALMSMDRSFEGLSVKPDLVIIDGPFVPPKLSEMSASGRHGIKSVSVIKGDDKVKVVSCASVIAKVFRDDIMIALDKEYPEYGFKAHKGYPTREHKENIIKYGFSDIHRKTFKFRI